MLTVNPIVCHCCKKVLELPFKLEWEYEKERCYQCGNEDNKYRIYEFCSSLCLKNFVEKFHNHKHQWELSPLSTTATVNDGHVISVMAMCSICKETNWYCTDKKLIEKYSKIHKDYIELSKDLKNVNTRRSKKPVHK